MLNYATVRRHLLGVFGAVFLATGISLLIAKGIDDSRWSMMASICVRVGLTLGALWLAFPQLIDLTSRVPPWMLAAIVIGGLVIIARPRTILYVGPALAAIAVLQFIGWLFKPLPTPQPKKQSKPKRPGD
jgi:hypothetical protein